MTKISFTVEVALRTNNLKCNEMSKKMAMLVIKCQFEFQEFGIAVLRESKK